MLDDSVGSARRAGCDRMHRASPPLVVSLRPPPQPVRHGAVCCVMSCGVSCRRARNAAAMMNIVNNRACAVYYYWVRVTLSRYRLCVVSNVRLGFVVWLSFLLYVRK